MAVASKAIVSHSESALSSGERVALGLGISLFLLAFIIGNAITARTWLIERITAVAAINTVCLTAANRSAGAVAALVATALGASLASEAG